MMHLIVIYHAYSSRFWPHIPDTKHKAYPACKRDAQLVRYTLATNKRHPAQPKPATPGIVETSTRSKGAENAYNSHLHPLIYYLLLEAQL